MEEEHTPKANLHRSPSHDSSFSIASSLSERSSRNSLSNLFRSDTVGSNHSINAAEPLSTTPSRQNSNIFAHHQTPPSSPSKLQPKEKGIYKIIKDDFTSLFDPHYTKGSLDFESDEEDFLYTNNAAVLGKPFPQLSERQNIYGSPNYKNSASNNPQNPFGRGFAQIVSSVRNATPSINGSTTSNTTSSSASFSTPNRNAHLRESHRFHPVNQPPASFKQATVITNEPQYNESRHNSEESTDYSLDDESGYLLHDGTPYYGTITPKTFANQSQNKNAHVLRSKPNWPSSPKVLAMSQNGSMSSDIGNTGPPSPSTLSGRNKFRNSQSPLRTRTVILNANSPQTFKVNGISQNGQPQQSAFIYRFPTRFDEDDNDEGYLDIWVLLVAIGFMAIVGMSGYLLWSFLFGGGVLTRLSHDMLVKQYDIKLDWNGGVTDVVKGEVAMILDVTNRVKNITLNVGPALNVETLELTCTGLSCPAKLQSDWKIERERQMLLITLNRHIGPLKKRQFFGDFPGKYLFIQRIPKDTDSKLNYTLSVKYNTTIIHMDNVGDQGGIFYNEYTVDQPDDGGIKRKKVVLGTHLKPTGSRNVLPCLDEPGFPAIFKLSMTVPSKYFVLSNNPVSQILPSTSNSKNSTDSSMYKFSNSPIISPHYFSFIVTDLDKIVANWSPSSGKFEIFDNRVNDLGSVRTMAEEFVTISVYHKRGRGADALFALRSAVDGVQQFFKRLESEDGIKNGTSILTSLKKLDIVGVEGLRETVGGWGLVMINHDHLTLSALDVSPETLKYTLMKEITRNIAHHWFGGYRPINWWNENWLTEGLSHYHDTVNDIDLDFPDHDRLADQIWSFRSDAVIPQLIPQGSNRKIRTSRNAKLAGQEYLNPHAIHIHEDQVTTSSFLYAFDDIISHKTKSVFRMIADYLSKIPTDDDCDILCRTFKSYVQSANATSTKLFIESVPNTDDDLDLKQMLETWILQSGYPIISVSKVPDGFKIEQELFTEWALPDDQFYTRWTIPVTFSTEGIRDEKFEIFESKAMLLESKEPIVVLNPRRMGGYRVAYEVEILKRICEPSFWFGLLPASRAGILADSMAMLRTNRVPEENVDALLSVTKNLAKETDILVWKAAVDSFYDLQLVVSNSSSGSEWNKYLSGLLDNIVSVVIFNATVEDASVKRDLASLIGSFAVSIRHPGVVDWAIKAFRKIVLGGYCTDRAEEQDFIAAWLLDTVYAAAMRYSGDPELVYDVVLRAYLGYDYNAKYMSSECKQGGSNKKLPGNLLKALFTTPIRELQKHSIFLLDGMLLDGCRGSDDVSRDKVFELLETMIEKAPGGYLTVWDHVVLPHWWKTSDISIDKKLATNIARCVAPDGMANGNVRVSKMVDRVVQRMDNLNLVELFGAKRVERIAVGGGMYSIQRASARSIISKQFRIRWAKEIEEWCERNLR